MPPTTSNPGQTEHQAALVETLNELEAVRQETAKNISARIKIGVPLGFVVGLVFCWYGYKNGDGDLIALIVPLGFCVGIGYFWATAGPSNKYRMLYKDKVLGKLASRFGDLDYRRSEPPDLAKLSRQMVFPAFDAMSSEDEISGKYRGLGVAIWEITMTKGRGKHRRTVFDGLLAELELPRTLSGETTIVADSGGVLNFAKGLGQSGRERVRIEDPEFERHYEVWSNDQVAARALLAPAFIERFLALGNLPGFSRLSAHAEDNYLMMAMPKTGGRNLFEPPSYKNPAASGASIAAINNDISAVLRVVDAMIDLDEFSRFAAVGEAQAPVVMPESR